jgi:hypothetical protein
MSGRNLPCSITARNKSRMDIVVELGTRYNILRDQDAPRSDFAKLAADYLLHRMYVPGMVREAVGLVAPRDAPRSTRTEYRNRIIALLEHGPQSARQVARTLKRSQTQASEMLNKMAGEGLVERAGPQLAAWRLVVEQQPELIKEPA